MATREEARRLEEARQQELGQQFLRQMGDMFTQTRADMAAQFVPRPEFSAHMEKMDQVLEGLEKTVERIGGNVSTFHESAPRIFADRAETKQDIAELHTEIEKLKTARESDMQRGYGWRFEDVQGRMRADTVGERGWRGAMQERSTQTVNMLWLAGLALIGLVSPIVSLIVALALRK